MGLGNIKLATKIVYLFLSTVFFGVVIGYLCFKGMDRIIEQAYELDTASRQYEEVLTLHNMVTDALHQGLLYLVSSNREFMDRHKEEGATIKLRLSELISQETSSRKEKWEEVQQDYINLESLLGQLFLWESYPSAESKKDRESLLRQWQAKSEDLQTGILVLQGDYFNAVQKNHSQMGSTHTRVSTQLIIWMVVLSLLLIGLSSYLGRLLAQPFRNLTAAIIQTIEAVAKGEEIKFISAPGSDESEAIAAALNRLMVSVQGSRTQGARQDKQREFLEQEARKDNIEIARLKATLMEKERAIILLKEELSHRKN